jgi:hypothetical protein
MEFPEIRCRKGDQVRGISGSTGQYKFNQDANIKITPPQKNGKRRGRTSPGITSTQFGSQQR